MQENAIFQQICGSNSPGSQQGTINPKTNNEDQYQQIIEQSSEIQVQLIGQYKKKKNVGTQMCDRVNKSLQSGILRHLRSQLRQKQRMIQEKTCREKIFRQCTHKFTFRTQQLARVQKLLYLEYQSNLKTFLEQMGQLYDEQQFSEIKEQFKTQEPIKNKVKINDNANKTILNQISLRNKKQGDKSTFTVQIDQSQEAKEEESEDQSMKDSFFQNFDFQKQQSKQQNQSEPKKQISLDFKPALGQFLHNNNEQRLVKSNMKIQHNARKQKKTRRKQSLKKIQNQNKFVYPITSSPKMQKIQIASSSEENKLVLFQQTSLQIPKIFEPEKLPLPSNYFLQTVTQTQNGKKPIQKSSKYKILNNQYTYRYNKKKTFLDLCIDKKSFQLSQINKLGMLDVSRIQMLSLGQIQMTDEGLELITSFNWANLQSLNIWGNQIRNLTSIRKLKLQSLFELVACWNPLNQSSAQFLAAQSFPQLFHLQVSFEQNKNDQYFNLMIQNQLKNYPNLATFKIYDSKQIKKQTRLRLRKIVDHQAKIKLKKALSQHKKRRMWKLKHYMLQIVWQTTKIQYEEKLQMYGCKQQNKKGQYSQVISSSNNSKNIKLQGQNTIQKKKKDEYKIISAQKKDGAVNKTKKIQKKTKKNQIKKASHKKSQQKVSKNMQALQKQKINVKILQSYQRKSPKKQ